MLVLIAYWFADMKQIAIAITCCFAIALVGALIPIVIMQHQRNLVAQHNQQRIEAGRLEEQHWALEQKRLEVDERGTAGTTPRNTPLGGAAATTGAGATAAGRLEKQQRTGSGYAADNIATPATPWWKGRPTTSTSNGIGPASAPKAVNGAVATSRSPHAAEKIACTGTLTS